MMRTRAARPPSYARRSVLCDSHRSATSWHRTTCLDPLPMRPIKTVRESQHETAELMMPEHANNMQQVFGGVVLSMMDKCAAISAYRHSRAVI